VAVHGSNPISLNEKLKFVLWVLLPVIQKRGNSALKKLSAPSKAQYDYFGPRSLQTSLSRGGWGIYFIGAMPTIGPLFGGAARLDKNIRD